MLKKPLLYILGVIMVLFLLGGCSKGTIDEVSFKGSVLEVGDDYLMVEPAEGSKELDSADKIVLRIKKNTKLSYKAKSISIEDIVEGSRVEIYYNGEIAESYPAQINNISRVLLLEDYHMIYWNDEEFNGGLTLSILKTTELKKGEVYTIPFS